MSTVLENDLREIQARVRDLDREIAGKQEAFDKHLDEMRAKATSLADLSAEDSKAILDAGKEIDGMKEQALQLRDLAQTVMQKVGGVNTGYPESVGAGQSFAAMLMSHPAYKGLDRDALMSAMAIGGNLPGVDVLDRKSVIRALRSGENMFQAAATGILDSGIPLDQRLYPPIETLRRQIRLLSLITVGATDSDTVVFARQTTRTAAAAETALGTAYGEASFDFEKVTSTVRSIGHFTTVYREQVADAAQFETIIENQLQEDVMLYLESQILSGDGSGDHLEGILNTPNVQSVTRDTTNERRVEAIHRAITEIRLAFREPDAILLHPNDYQETLFEKAGTDSAGNYVWLGALMGLAGDTPATLWGKPVVVSPVAVEGTGVVAYWKDATLWQRTGLSLRLSDSHSDYFTKRQVAVLADMRGAFSVQRPQAFCEVKAL